MKKSRSCVFPFHQPTARILTKGGPDLQQVSVQRAYWDWGDRSNGKPEPWRSSSSSSGSIYDLAFKFLFSWPSPSVAQQPAAVHWRNLGSHTVFITSSSQIFCSESLSAGTLDLDVWFQPSHFSSVVWSQCEGQTVNQLPHPRDIQKPGDDRTQANDFHTALTALITFSLTKPVFGRERI